jgi:hypothetical protein
MCGDLAVFWGMARYIPSFTSNTDVKLGIYGAMPQKTARSPHITALGV